MCLHFWRPSHGVRMHLCAEAARVACNEREHVLHGGRAMSLPRGEDPPCGGVTVPACRACWDRLPPMARLAVLAGQLAKHPSEHADANTPKNAALAVENEWRWL